MNLHAIQCYSVRQGQCGFTLVEISIVLVIIGLLVGGILAGSELIRASEMRSIVSDKERFLVAVHGFQAKYSAILGDFANAQEIWGSAAICTSSQTTIATCNGDGDGSIERGVGSGNVGNELFLFWKHLSNDGFIGGNFVGIKDGSTSYATTANNAPSGKITSSLWYVENLDWAAGLSWAWSYRYGNSFQFGLPKANQDPWASVLTSAEMFALDNKIDDGKPGTVRLIADRSLVGCVVKADGVTAAASTDYQTAIYKTSSTDKQCYLLFIKVF